MIPDWPGSPVLGQSPYSRQGVDNMVRQHEIEPNSNAACEGEGGVMSQGMPRLLEAGKDKGTYSPLVLPEGMPPCRF